MQIGVALGRRGMRSQCQAMERARSHLAEVRKRREG